MSAPTATLRLPDGREVALPVLTDASGALFVDVRKLQPDTGAPLRSVCDATTRLLLAVRRRVHL